MVHPKENLKTGYLSYPVITLILMVLFCMYSLTLIQKPMLMQDLSFIHIHKIQIKKNKILTVKKVPFLHNLCPLKYKFSVHIFHISINLSAIMIISIPLCSSYWEVKLHLVTRLRPINNPSLLSVLSNIGLPAQHCHKSCPSSVFKVIRHAE